MSYYHNIGDLLFESANKYKDLIAFSFNNEDKLVNISYEKFLHDVYGAISYMNENCSSEKHIALAGHNSYFWIVLFYAITISGRIVVLPNTSLNIEEFCEEINMADVTFLFCDNLLFNQIDEIKKRCPNLLGYKKIESLKSCNNSVTYSYNIEGTQPAAILFTSGTSAKPKPVLLSHENLSANASCTDLGFSSYGKFLSILPNYHVFSLVINILWPVNAGFCNCLCQDGKDYLYNLKNNNITFTSVVPSMLKPLSKMLKFNNKLSKDETVKKVFGNKLQCIAIGGSYVDLSYVELFESFNIPLRVGYGLTETSSIISTNVFNVYKNGSVGKIQDICEVKINDNEVFVRGKNVMLGYYKMPQNTDEAFEDGWFKTGDIGYVDSDNYLYITGRKKNVIITSNGENVSPEQIEENLCMHDEIERAHAYQKDDKIFVDVVLLNQVNGEDINDLLLKIKDEFNANQPSWKKINTINVVANLDSKNK